MNFSVSLSALLLMGAAFAATGAPAKTQKPQPKADPVKLTLSQDLLHSISKDGKLTEERIPAPSAVLPGSNLLEEITARNSLNAAVKGVVVRLAIPAGTTYTSLVPAGSPRWKAQYSIDGGKTYTGAPTRKVAQGGKMMSVLATPREYTNVRWLIGSMSAGETLKVGFKVKVN